MKKLLLPFLLAFCACHEQDVQDPCTMLQGVWSAETQDVWGHEKTYTYSFSDGLCIAWEYSGGQKVSEWSYAYQCFPDATLQMENLSTHGSGTYYIKFENPTICVLSSSTWDPITLKKLPQ